MEASLKRREANSSTAAENIRFLLGSLRLKKVFVGIGITQY